MRSERPQCGFRRQEKGSAVATCLATLIAGALALGLAPLLGAASAQPSGLGRIDFPTSGSPAAQPEFLHGVAALHSFEYEEAAAAFQRARGLDPSFVMAYWGEALAHHSVLAGSRDLSGARRVLQQLGPTPAARAARARAERERGLLAAVEALFGDGDDADRDRAYASAMEQLHARFPEDDEIASVSALALLDTAIRATYGLNAAPAEGHHVHRLAGSDTQRKAGEILRNVLRRNPQHPGAAHYLLHTYDDAEHAAEALDVARKYAQIAPASSHAQHMPAHIFVQLGLWHDAAASDDAASEAAEASASRKDLDPSRIDYHPFTWLQYERLQLGQLAQARGMMEQMQRAAATTGSSLLKNHAASMRARYVVEGQRWELLRDGDDFGNLDELVAIGMSAARGGNPERADQVRELFERFLTGAPPTLAPALVVMRHEVAGLLDLAAGRRDAAVQSLRVAAETEAELPTGMGPPRPIKPAQELLGEVLLEVGRPAEARAAFDRALQRNPNRSLSLLGLARAAAASDDPVAARHYAALASNWSEADADLPWLNEVRAGRAPSSKGFTSRPLARAGLAAVLAALGGGAFLALRRRRREGHREDSGHRVGRASPRRTQRTQKR